MKDKRIRVTVSGTDYIAEPNQDGDWLLYEAGCEDDGYLTEFSHQPTEADVVNAVASVLFNKAPEWTLDASGQAMVESKYGATLRINCDVLDLSEASSDTVPLDVLCQAIARSPSGLAAMREAVEQADAGNAAR